MQRSSFHFHKASGAVSGTAENRMLPREAPGTLSYHLRNPQGPGGQKTPLLPLSELPKGHLLSGTGRGPPVLSPCRPGVFSFVSKSAPPASRADGSGAGTGLWAAQARPEHAAHLPVLRGAQTLW